MPVLLSVFAVVAIAFLQTMPRKFPDRASYRDTGYKMNSVQSQIGTWCPRQESNLYHSLRRGEFYPLNYGGGDGILQAASKGLFGPTPTTPVASLACPSPSKFAR